MTTPVCSMPSKFKGNLTYEKACNELPQKIIQYYREFDRRFGGQATSFVGSVTLKDAIPNPQAITEKSNSSVSYHSTNDEIEFFTEDLYLKGPKHLKHEIFHSWMRNRLGYERYRNTPKWFKEGMAVYAAGDLENVLSNVLALSLPRRWITDSLAQSVDKIPISFYGQSALTVEFIDKVYGKKNAVQSLLKLLGEGKKIDEALLAVAKHPQTIEDFHKQARDYAATRMLSFDQVSKDFFLSKAFQFSSNFQSAYQGEQALTFTILSGELKQNPSSSKVENFRKALQAYQGKVFDPVRNMLLGLVHFTRGNYNEAASVFKKEIERKDPSIYYPTANYYHGLALYLANPKANRDQASKDLEQVMKVGLQEKWRGPAREQLDRLSRGENLDSHLWIF